MCSSDLSAQLWVSVVHKHTVSLNKYWKQLYKQHKTSQEILSKVIPIYIWLKTKNDSKHELVFIQINIIIRQFCFLPTTCDHRWSRHTYVSVISVFSACLHNMNYCYLHYIRMKQDLTVVVFCAQFWQLRWKLKSYVNCVCIMRLGIFVLLQKFYAIVYF